MRFAGLEYSKVSHKIMREDKVLMQPTIIHNRTTKNVKVHFH